MTPLKLSLHNFLSYQNPKPLDFSTFDLGVLLGENGAGKSSILEALTWAVWEKTRATSTDDLIHQGCQEMWVDFSFEHEGQTYRIFRRRDKRKEGRSSLEFQILDKKKGLLGDSWKTITESTLRLTQDKITQTLKLPYEIFINTSYLRQGRADEFTIKTPAERKKILGEILGLEEWWGLEEKVKNKIKLIENQAEAIHFQIESLKKQVSVEPETKKEFQDALSDKKNLQQKQKIMEDKFQKLDYQKRKSDLAESRINDLRDKLQDVQENLKRLEGEKVKNILEIKNFCQILKDKVQIEKKIKDLQLLKKQLFLIESRQESYQKLKEKLIYYEHQKAELEFRMAKIEKIATCPTCLRKMTNEEAKKIIQMLLDNFKKIILPQKMKIENQLEKLNYNPKIHQELRQDFAALENVEDKKRNLAVAETNIENLKKMNNKIAQDIKNFFLKRHQIIKIGKVLKTEFQKLQNITPEWTNVRERIEKERQSLLLIQGKLGGLEQSLKDIVIKKDELQAKERALLKNEKEKTVLGELQEAFGKNGIQAMIIEQALPAIEENANQILRKVSDDQLTLKFLTQRGKKTASEELIETLEIKITDSAGERDYEMFSGGEAFRINFAVRIALSKFLAVRSGIHLKFLAMDEGFGSLDTAGKEDLISTINSIKEDFQKIIIITHIQELKDLFPTQILISKTPDGSQIEVLA